jgi:hypothetical protein
MRGLEVWAAEKTGLPKSARSSDAKPIFFQEMLEGWQRISGWDSLTLPGNSADTSLRTD